jgi:hypothetical protein
MKKTAEYSYAYLIGRKEQLPADFPLAVNFEQVISGILLPARAYGRLRGLRSPACIVLLLPKLLLVSLNPREGGTRRTIPLHEILAVESRRVFPEGRITVRTKNSTHEWPYDVHAEGFVIEFMYQLRHALLSDKGTQRGPGRSIFGEPVCCTYVIHTQALNHKFGCAESDHLDRGEPLITRFFSAPSTAIRKRWLFKIRLPVPGQYLAVTPRRVVWITDQVDGIYQPTGILSSYAPLQHLVGIALHCQEKNCEMNLSFDGGLYWRVPIQTDFHDEAKSFVKQARRLLVWQEAEKRA